MDITIIIPIHEFNTTVETMLKKALISVAQQNNVEEKRDVLIVAAAILNNNQDWLTFVNTFEFETLNINILKNEGKTDFQSQVNFGAKQVTTKYFSILEFDDEYSSTYFDIMDKYTNSKEFETVDIFLPIIVETNTKDEALKLTNELVWSKESVGENGTLGYLNTTLLNQQTDFKLCGFLIKTSEFNNIGGLKSNIHLTFQYEFLLRVLNNGSKVYTVPKIGYKHLLLREGSLFDNISKSMSLKERAFWFQTAKSESHFFNDRPINYSSLETVTKNIA
jgi:hypothetical protein